MQALPLYQAHGWPEFLAYNAVMDDLPKRRHLWFSWLLFTALVALATLALTKLAAHQPIVKVPPGYYRVVKFDDGDTIVVDMNGTQETVRFIGVDTPETHKPNTPVQCYGSQAAAYTKQLIGNQAVRLVADQLDTNRDRYGRLLRYVYLPNGTLVDEKLVTEGYGFAYTYFPFTKKPQFRLAEAEAKAAQRGLWHACQVRVESSGVKQTNALQ